MTKKRSEIDPGTLPLVELVPKMLEAFSRNQGEGIVLLVPDPALNIKSASGTIVETPAGPGRHRPYRSWADLADGLDCRLGTPEKTADGRIRLPFFRLDMRANWHEDDAPEDPTEKYGTNSAYAALNKLEEPAFAVDLVHAIRLCRKKAKARVLVLGVNDGRELPAFPAALGREVASTMTFVGVDHCASAIEKAKATYPPSNHDFLKSDINSLDPEEIGRFDLILSIGTLQSRGIKLKPAFMHLFQNLLEPDGSVILGFPNCRHIDNDLVYGAMVRNWPDSDMANLIRDIHFCRKYLQQHKCGVRVFGKYYIFMVGYRV